MNFKSQTGRSKFCEGLDWVAYFDTTLGVLVLSSTTSYVFIFLFFARSIRKACVETGHENNL